MNLSKKDKPLQNRINRRGRFKKKLIGGRFKKKIKSKAAAIQKQRQYKKKTSSLIQKQRQYKKKTSSLIQNLIQKGGKELKTCKATKD